MSEEARKTLDDWLVKMANQDNQCLENLVKTDSRKAQDESTDQENNNNKNFSNASVDKIEYYLIERFYDDNIYKDMKSGKMSTKSLQFYYNIKYFLVRPLSFSCSWSDS